MTNDPKGPNAEGMFVFTADDLATAERVKGLLREIDLEASDAKVAAATVTLCIETYTGRTVPLGKGGSEAIVLTDGEREILTHHANTAETSIRRVADAVEHAANTAKSLPSANVSTFDPVLVHVDRYRKPRELMESPAMADEEAMILHAEALAPFAGDTPPVVRSSKGAAEALKLLLSFNDIDKVDANIVRGVVEFLDGRV